MQKVAFFDIDGTVFRSSLLIELVEQLVREEVFPSDACEGYQTEYRAWLAREGSYDAYIKAVIGVFMTNIKGVHYGSLADVGRRVMALQSRHTYRYTRNLLQQLKDYLVVDHYHMYQI